MEADLVIGIYLNLSIRYFKVFDEFCFEGRIDFMFEKYSTEVVRNIL